MVQTLTVLSELCRRFRDPNPEEIEALTLEGMREAVMAQLHPGNIEINIVGDIAGAGVDDVVLQYLGTVSPREPAQPLTAQPPVILYPPAHLRRQAWHLKVSQGTMLAAIKVCMYECRCFCSFRSRYVRGKPRHGLKAFGTSAGFSTTHG